MATYAELANKVRDWSNRDAQVLTDSIIRDCVRYAADKAYRKLRIPPLELKVEYSLNADQAKARALPIPSDLTEFISLTKTGRYITELTPLDDAPEDTICEYDINGSFDESLCELTQTFQSLDDRKIVYNQKVDIRTFRDAQASHPQYPFWTREQGSILLSSFPTPSVGDVFELYYYGRMAEVSDDTVSNWLRDENERVLLFGALMEAFAYLGEDDMQAKYLQMFQEEIDELNREEEMRKASGGNTVIQYTSYLI